MYKSLLALAVASAAVAAPVTQEAESSKYHLMMTYNGETVPLKALNIHGSGEYVLGVSQPKDYTNVHFSKTHGQNLGLYLSAASETVEFKVPEVGDDYGKYGEVKGKKGYKDGAWILTKAGVVSHTYQAALNAFYACEANFGKEVSAYLSFGTPINNSSGLYPPTGCQNTNVTIRYDA